MHLADTLCHAAYSLTYTTLQKRPELICETPSEGFIALLQSAEQDRIRQLLFEERSRIRFDRKKLAALRRIHSKGASEEFRRHYSKALTNLEYYLSLTPPISSHNYYMFDTPLARLRCCCHLAPVLCFFHGGAAASNQLYLAHSS